MATAMYLAFNDPQKIDEAFPAPVPVDPAYQEAPYWGASAVEEAA